MPRKPPAEPPDIFTSTFSVMAPISESDLCALYVQHVVDECKGNKSVAAKVLGVDRRSLYRRLEKVRRRDVAKS